MNDGLHLISQFSHPMNDDVLLLSAFCHPLKDELDDEDEKPNGDLGRFGHMPQEGEPDFIETNCHWEECRVEYDTQDDLVKVGETSCIYRRL